MSKRTFASPLILFACFAITCASGEIAHREAYQPTEKSLAAHTAPTWYRDAKLGIFVHWGLYSVPGWAPIAGPRDGDFANRNWMALNPYAEWYYNTMRIEGSPSQEYHRTHFGRDFDYYQFAETFNRENKQWDPQAWAGLFKETGARYVVLTTKHHDGFTLWPTAVANPHQAAGRAHATRDLVGDLTSAVRQRGMRMGLYYSGGFDWTFSPGPFHDQKEASAGTPPTEEYANYVDAQYHELIERYKPDILWNDISYPPHGHALALFADYYAVQPEGMVNDRWAPFKHADVVTPEYKSLGRIQSKPWEECRGLGQSFGFNRAEGEAQTIEAGALVHLLIDVVSKNGNLLLDVGPQADGTIPAVQVDRLQALGRWLKQNGEAIFDTRPWSRAEGRTLEGTQVRFTRKGATVYATLLGKPSGASVTFKDLNLPVHAITLIGSPGELQWSRHGSDLLVHLPDNLPGEFAWVIKVI